MDAPSSPANRTSAPGVAFVNIPLLRSTRSASIADLKSNAARSSRTLRNSSAITKSLRRSMSSKTHSNMSPAICFGTTWSTLLVRPWFGRVCFGVNPISDIGCDGLKISLHSAQTGHPRTFGRSIRSVVKPSARFLASKGSNNRTKKSMSAGAFPCETSVVSKELE